MRSGEKFLRQPGIETITSRDSVIHKFSHSPSFKPESTMTIRDHPLTRELLPCSSAFLRAARPAPASD